MSSIYELRFEEIGTLEGDRETLLSYLNDEDKQGWLAVGSVMYKTHCVNCHGADGGGIVGPNLTDEHWKNVRKIEDLVTVIEQGAANGAMPAWKNRINHPNQRILTAVYVASLRGKPISGKAAEGDKIKPWNEE